jgi:hypothetical protein
VWKNGFFRKNEEPSAIAPPAWLSYGIGFSAEKTGIHRSLPAKRNSISIPGFPFTGKSFLTYRESDILSAC